MNLKNSNRYHKYNVLIKTHNYKQKIDESSDFSILYLPRYISIKVKIVNCVLSAFASLGIPMCQ